MEEKKASGKARLEHRSRLRTTQQPGDLQQKWERGWRTLAAE
ncbi:hypothetical protein SNOG_12098 [Parastagonospora nodorum SN15]|uniref:Uncharacterized protein n=1 Tax=Phaeosphaeria nodorum (strain SN15 / ATCC MYA-4574 / FGSC 10173) TaxID=321614 RepID=Q0U816_PHANO|nr:hypothetical protein SNOG_12098 [Parastagonospora nodorum SN15]EAT80510.1 hypothetical protein SNOG_12098 [Parastagonospora nodorum SN15]